MNRFYYTDSTHQPRGPISFEEMTALAAKGEVKKDTLVFQEGATAWTKWVLLANGEEPPKASVISQILKIVGTIVLVVGCIMLAIHFYGLPADVEAAAHGTGRRLRGLANAAILLAQFDNWMDSKGVVLAWLMRVAMIGGGGGLLFQGFAMSNKELAPPDPATAPPAPVFP